ncbi:hypothetical protein BT96DRAFT_89975 [Gymnopus androsaceus JB14]|uniref:Uncharacterized protein n=1 Tax=Gymnopus androsaceus JB14 TaxID=1447944 RepID=A0A6A4HGN4_9AGAR|nr:hypothetical protein BT96DRAFT_89975 [Gymnopus androsaceus JB14]
MKEEKQDCRQCLNGRGYAVDVESQGYRVIILELETIILRCRNTSQILLILKPFTRSHTLPASLNSKPEPLLCTTSSSAAFHTNATHGSLNTTMNPLSSRTTMPQTPSPTVCISEPSSSIQSTGLYIPILRIPIARCSDFEIQISVLLEMEANPATCVDSASEPAARCYCIIHFFLRLLCIPPTLSVNFFHFGFSLRRFIRGIRCVRHTTHIVCRTLGVGGGAGRTSTAEGSK